MEIIKVNRNFAMYACMNVRLCFIVFSTLLCSLRHFPVSVPHGMYHWGTYALFLLISLAV